jgi:hypothetical protein
VRAGHFVRWVSALARRAGRTAGGRNSGPSGGPRYEWQRAAWRTGALAALTASAMLFAQQPQNVPHAGYVYPAGGQQATTVRVVVGGQFLDGTTSAIVSGTGIDAHVVDFDKPLNGQPLTELRDKLQAIQKQTATPALQAEMVALRDKIADATRRNQSPVLSERLTLDVTIAPGAALGPRQLRLNTTLGLTSPLTFVVGQLPEFRERDVKNTPADAELPITLPATVNGRLIPGDIDRVKFPNRLPPAYMPGDVDRYRFTARKGEHLVCVASARDLIPYLADAVPGWFQATLALYDANGHELAYDDDYRFHPDPVLHVEVPADGEYVVEIKDAIYRGREDFVYRISIGELPFLTSLFPLGARAGSSTRVEAVGWNLPASSLVVDAKNKPTGVYPIGLSTEDLASNRLPFAVDTLPEVFEKEPNNSAKNAQNVTLPVIINGRIQQPGDWDVFSFKGRAGDAVVAEVTARRLESPLDSVLDLTDAAGKRLAFNDDTEDMAAGLETHHADSYLMTTLPANGTYFVRIGDIQHKGGPEYAYRLRLSAPRPDFELRVSPSGLNVTGGGTIPVTVTAVRRDGFTGDIALALSGSPAGFALGGALLPASQDHVRMTLTAPSAATATPTLLSLRVEGRASIDGRTVVRQAVPADDMEQAFAYHHLVVADDLRVLTSGRGGTRVPSRIVSAEPVRIPVGGSSAVRVSIPPGYATFANIQFELSDPPEGFTVSDSAVLQTNGTFALHADPAKIKAGLRGNLIVTVSGERVPAANAPSQVRRRVIIGTLPAIAFEIVPPRRP